MASHSPRIVRCAVAIAALAAVFATPQAFAGGDDLLAPLVPVVPRGTLVVRLSGKASTATVSVDGVELGPADGTSREVAAGIHELVVSHSGFKPFEQSVTVRPKAQTDLTVTLEPTSGLLTVDADVPSADVFVDGQALGKAPVTGLQLTPGVHEVSVRTLDGAQDSAKLVLRAGQESVFRAHLRPADRPAMTQLEPRNVSPGRTNAASPDLTVSRTNEGGISPWVWVGAGAAVAAGVVTAVLLTQPHGKPLTAADVCNGACDGTVNAPGLIHF